MTDEMKNLIESCIRTTVADCVSGLKGGTHKRSDADALFAKTESLLYHYPLLQNAITARQEELDEIQKYGIPQRSKSITMATTTVNYIDRKSDMELKEEKAETSQEQIDCIQKKISFISGAINSLKEDPYFDLIRLKYFEGKSREEIAEYFSVDEKTVTRNKNRLINHLTIKLFPDEYLKSFLES